MRGFSASCSIKGIGIEIQALQELSPWVASIAAVLLPFIQRLGAATARPAAPGAGSCGSLRAPSPSTGHRHAEAGRNRTVAGAQGMGDPAVAVLVCSDRDRPGAHLAVSGVFNSLHQLYRRPDEHSLPDPTIPKVDNFCLGKIDPAATPSHLINAALNVPGSRFANRRGRNADFFLFSRRFIGSEATDYVKTEDAERVVDRLNIGTAMAISGAAIAGMGMASIVFAHDAPSNIRLGRWIQHPHVIQGRTAAIGTEPIGIGGSAQSGPRYLRGPIQSGMTLRRDKTNRVNGKGFLFLSDGGHIENLGVRFIAASLQADYSRRCRSRPDGLRLLVQLERFARIDLDTRITIDWRPISAAPARSVRRSRTSRSSMPRARTSLWGHRLSAAKVPNQGRGAGRHTRLSRRPQRRRERLHYFHEDRYPLFPRESTADQLFSEEQLEGLPLVG